MVKEFLDAIGLNNFFRSIKGLFAKKEDVEVLRKYFQVVEIRGNLLGITDNESNILCLIDANGKVHHPLGTVTSKALIQGDAIVGGTHFVQDVKLQQGDESTIFNLLDQEDHMLIWVNQDGTTDFYGIPQDVKTEIDTLKQRISALEGE